MAPPAAHQKDDEPLGAAQDELGQRLGAGGGAGVAVADAGDLQITSRGVPKLAVIDGAAD